MSMIIDFGAILSFGLILVIMAIYIIIACFTAALTIMPYISGMLISLLVSTQVPFAKNIIPGHPVMNYLSVLFVVEAVIGILMHLKWTGKATALCFSEIMVGIISMFILDSIKPDSVGFCVFATIVYMIGNIFFLASNSARYESKEKNTSVGIIISSIIYAVAAYFIVAIPAELLWQRYIENAKPAAVPVFNIIYLMIRILICGGIVVMGIKRSRQPADDIEIVENKTDMLNS